MPTKDQLALIHVAKNRLGLEESEYREILAGLGVESSKELDDRGVEALIRHFRKLGFEPLKKGRRVPATAPLLSKVRALCNELGVPWSYAEKIGQTMFGQDGKVAVRLRLLGPEQLYKVVQALAVEKRKREKKVASSG